MTTDAAGGYGPALDTAYGLYIQTHGLATTVTTTDTDDAHAYCFQALLQAVVYDLAIPGIAATGVDVQVDAPLTNVKWSQKFRQYESLRDAAWERASACGYGLESNVGGFKVNFDFKEPGHEGAREYG